MHVITQGDDVTRLVTITRDRVAVAIDSGATVRAVLVSGGTAYGPVSCLSAAAGADWDNGIVAFTFPEALSSTFPLGKATIQVEVDDSGEETWHIDDVYVRSKGF